MAGLASFATLKAQARLRAIAAAWVMGLARRRLIPMRRSRATVFGVNTFQFGFSTERFDSSWQRAISL